MVVGTKGHSIGNTYASVSEFLDLTNNDKLERSINGDEERNSMYEVGRMLIRGLVTCHELERYNNGLSGTMEERYLFEFSGGRYIDENIYECLEERLRIEERIYFNERDKKLGVVVELGGGREGELIENSIKLEEVSIE
jgi:hypothetical protein